MSAIKTSNGFEVIESSDMYHCPIHGWLTIPAFWIGDLVALHSHSIQDRTGRVKSTKHIAR